MNSLDILGIKITPGEPKDLHRKISSIIEKGGPGFVLSGNVHGLNLARRLRWLRKFYNQADVVRVDGAGIVLGAWILGFRIPKRLTWADWGWSFAEYIADQGHSLYLLGGPEKIAEKAAHRLQRHADGINILGTHHGYFPKSGPENETVISEINRVSPDILIVGFGMPLQEHWIIKNYKKIRSKVFITAGAGLEYLSGELKRCPRWMGEAGLEWVYRLIQQPRHKAKRYLWGNTSFILEILKQRIGLLSG